MYKIIIISSFLTLSLIKPVLLQADNLTYSFVGAQTSLISYENTTAPSFGLKFGKQADMWRTTLSIDYSTDGSDSTTSLFLESDRGILSELFKDSKFQPYVGFSVGMLQHKNETTDSGSGYGLNTGLTYIFNNDIDLDFGIRVLNVKGIDAVGHMNNLTCSLHYFY